MKPRKHHPKPRPTHCFGMCADDLRRYFRIRTLARKSRWERQRWRRVSRWSLEYDDEPHPVPGLQRLLNEDVRAFDASYYCIASQRYSEHLPPTHALIQYSGNILYQVEVFCYLGNPTPDPCLARVHCLTVRGLRNRVKAALTALGPEPNEWGLIPVNQGWCDNLEDLILHEDTSPAMRVEMFRQLVRKLTVNEATALTQTLLADIKSRKPGMPGYAAKHGLHVDALA